MKLKKTKVLVITDSLASANLHQIRPESAWFFGAQASGEVDITVMCDPKHIPLSHYTDGGLQVVEYAVRKRFSLTAVRFIRALVRARGFEILHLMNSRAIRNGATAAIGLPVKVVAYRGQTGALRRWSLPRYLGMLHPRIDKITCVARAAENEVRETFGRNKNKAVTVYKGHNLAWYRAAPVSRAALGVPESAFAVVLSANLRPRKGLHVLMAATHFLPPALPVHILLLGANAGNVKMQKLIQTSAAPERVHVLGFRDDAPQVAGACNAVVLPTTKREGLSRAIIEGMAYARPVIASNTGGNAELVADGETGLVVPPGDARALAAAIAKLAANPALCERMGAAGQQRLREKFNVEQGVTKLLTVYRELARAR